MTGTVRIFLLALPAMVALMLGTPAAASTQPVAAAPNFGQHVSQCAQTMGFSGDHNPGMHRGASGWTGSPAEAGAGTMH